MAVAELESVAETSVRRWATGLSIALAVCAAATGLVLFAFGGVLRGAPVMNGSARGTALVMAVVGVPVLVVALVLARRGSARALFVWLGATLYLAYNAFLQLLGTPLNRVFLLTLLTLSLAIAASIAVVVLLDTVDVAARCGPTLPARAIAAFILAIVVLNALAWLARIVPALVADDPDRLLEGMGLTMVPTYLQDLAFWLPLLGIGAVWLWQRRPWGFVISGAGLAFWAIESVTVAVDQWFGHRADPASDVASDAVVLPFLLVGVITVGVLAAFLRPVD
jgi:hypothetical protein